MSDKYRFRREVIPTNEDGTTDPFEWPNDGNAGIACARGMYDGDWPCIEVYWREWVPEAKANADLKAAADAFWRSVRQNVADAKAQGTDG